MTSLSPLHGALTQPRGQLHERASAPEWPRVGVVSTSRAGGDGVSYVGALIERAIAQSTGTRPWTVDLFGEEGARDSIARRARFAWRLSEAQRAGRTDLVVFNHLGPARAQRWIPAPWRKPYAVFVHGLEVTPDRLDPKRLATLRTAVLRVANSHFTAARLTREQPDIGSVEPCPLALLPEAPLRGTADAALLGRVRPVRAALIVGRMSAAERYKGHDQLIECWPAVLACVPDAQLVVVGGGDDVERLRTKTTAAGIAGDVLFCGRVSDATLRELYARAALFAMPSRGEGFGLVYLEAMRASLPCIASPDDAGQDVVVDGETGALIPQSETARLADAVVALLSDPQRARELGAAGRCRYESHFTFERFRTRLAALLIEAHAAARRRR